MKYGKQSALSSNFVVNEYLQNAKFVHNICNLCEQIEFHGSNDIPIFKWHLINLSKKTVSSMG